MSLERIDPITPALRGECPVCAAWIMPALQVEVTEILSCPECRTMLVIDRIEGPLLRLSEAPQIEEDWGE